MSPRLYIGKKVIRLGLFIQSLAMAVMRPADLIEFSRKSYEKQNSVAGWSATALIDSGLNAAEEDLLEHTPIKNGRLLLLGVGGGREAIPLARLGFAVTGVDFIPDMVEKARENAIKNGVEFDGIVQEISRLDVGKSVFDVAWLSAAMYSCVPTRKRRSAMLQKIQESLKPGGFFVCQYHWDESSSLSPFGETLQKLFAIFCFGNISLEKGDRLWFNKEFIHAFHSEAELKQEFMAAGFEIIHFVRPCGLRGGAVLRKPDRK